MRMKDTTERCFLDYLSGIPTGRDSVKARSSMIEFLGTNMDTSRRWLMNKRVPVGLMLVKLRYFLEREGYQITELLGLEKAVYNLGKLIAYGVLEFKVVSDRMGYPDKNSLLQLLHGKQGLSGERRAIMEEIVGENEKSLSELPEAPIEEMKERLVIASKTKSVFTGENEELFHLIGVLKGVLIVVLPKLEVIVSDEKSPEYRKKFREESGDNFVFETSNLAHRITQLLNALCGERARNEILGRGKM